MRGRSHRRTRWACTALALTVVAAGFAAASPAHAVAASQQGGIVLDGWGGLHPFGGAGIDTRGAPYWKGWNIARSISVRADGTGGWTLDGFGGIHPWGAAPRITPTPTYWPNWDIARALVVTPDETGGYVLDGWGGLHRFGSAPRLTGTPYWAGWDIARGLAIHYDAGGLPDGGWVLDGFGGIHRFGGAPAVPGPTYYGGYDVWNNIHTAGSAVYAVGRFGVTLGLQGSPSPYWTGYSDWGSWDILRDVVLLDPTNPVAQAQPASAAAKSAFTAAHTPRPGVLARPECGAPPAYHPGKWIVVSLACQELNAYQDGRVVIDTFVTTGEPALPTPPGHYSVLRKSSPFEMISSWPYGTIGWYAPSWVQYVLWFRNDGYGIHDSWWRSAYGPGTNLHGSHGCINVPLAAETPLYAWAPVGTPVDVY